MSLSCTVWLLMIRNGIWNLKIFRNSHRLCKHAGRLHKRFRLVSDHQLWKSSAQPLIASCLNFVLHSKSSAQVMHKFPSQFTCSVDDERSRGNRIVTQSPTPRLLHSAMKGNLFPSQGIRLSRTRNAIKLHDRHTTKVIGAKNLITKFLADKIICRTTI